MRISERLYINTRRSKTKICQRITTKIVAKRDDSALTILLAPVDLRTNQFTAHTPAMTTAKLLEPGCSAQLVLRSDDGNRRSRPQSLNHHGRVDCGSNRSR